MIVNSRLFPALDFAQNGRVPKSQPAIPVEPPDSHYLLAAIGWLELGNLQEALVELEGITPRFNRHPEVLDARWQILARQENWHECVETASKIILQAPEKALGWIHRSYALHELKRTLEARDNLLPVVDRFPEEALIRYNLACYECQLARLDEARSWLRKAIKIGGKKDIRAMALQDADLQPLWPEIKLL
jgi:tetratricopeptide (TPR) repeat protein